jgi:hypothetical protein
LAIETVVPDIGRVVSRSADETVIALDRLPPSPADSPYFCDPEGLKALAAVPAEAVRNKKEEAGERAHSDTAESELFGHKWLCEFEFRWSTA